LETSGPDFTLQGDRIHLTNVVYNLIDNALKYSYLNPEIGLRITRDNASLRLLVQDNGIGIAPEHQPRIFDKFYRVDSGNVHNTKGHGLGLSYVANVIKKHGGRIEVDSAIGAGSRFTIVLPVSI
ncbi:MAG TPA: ATP-binding protein, partial [Saprospiraceae bacterium]|nr:ATP-binding protein [Saprospiraceae bacterium]